MLDSGPDFAQVSIGHSNPAAKEALNDSSLPLGKDVRPHLDSCESTTGKL